MLQAKEGVMTFSNLVTSLFLALGLVFTAQAQWINLPLPGTPRTNDGKPNLSAPAPRASDGHPDLSGIWISSRQFTNPKGRGLERFMPAGSKVPMLPAAEKFYAEITGNGRYDAADPSERCLPDGVPNHMLPLPIKIVQTPGLLLTLFEEFTVFRQIFTDGRKLPVAPQPTWFGYSVAHWEKNTLVVASAGFNDQTYLDGEGLPHSEDLRITERYRRPDFGHLVIEFTFTDPKYYERPWTATISFDLMPDTELMEHLCENEKDLVHTIRK
jgi:hypothetical protein